MTTTAVRPSPRGEAQPRSVAPTPGGFTASLSPRRRAVLMLLLAGCSTSEIAAQLWVSPKTVEATAADIHQAAIDAGICSQRTGRGRWLGPVGLRVGQEGWG